MLHTLTPPVSIVAASNFRSEKVSRADRACLRLRIFYPPRDHCPLVRLTAMQASPASRSGLWANGVAARAAAIVAGLIGLAAGGCGGSPPPTPDVPASFPAQALMAVDSSTSALHIELRSVPDPPVRGQNVGQLVVTDGTGQPVDGLTISVVPWMPSHGHGTSVNPLTTDDGGGVYVLNPLYLFMAGEWQLQMSFQGTVNDTATATVEIP